MCNIHPLVTIPHFTLCVNTYLLYATNGDNVYNNVVCVDVNVTTNIIRLFDIDARTTHTLTMNEVFILVRREKLIPVVTFQERG